MSGVFSEVILSFFLCLPSKLYGVSGAVVVACEACEATVGVQPLWQSVVLLLHVVCGACLHALPAVQAFVGTDTKLPVADEIAVEETAYHLGVEPWPSSAHLFADAFLAGSYAW